MRTKADKGGIFLLYFCKRSSLMTRMVLYHKRLFMSSVIDSRVIVRRWTCRAEQSERSRQQAEKELHTERDRAQRGHHSVSRQSHRHTGEVRSATDQHGHLLHDKGTAFISVTLSMFHSLFLLAGIKLLIETNR